MSAPARIAFFATGLARSVGGIASANRNVLAGLADAAAAAPLPHGAAVRAHVLHEPPLRTAAERAYGGSKLRFAVDVAAAAPGAALFAFDHVGLARPILALPRAARPPTIIFAHGSESWKRVKPASIAAFRAADLVLTNSTYTLRHMRETFDGFTGVACLLGLPPQFPLTDRPPRRATDRPSLRAADGIERPLGPRTMLLVGRMDPDEREKGHRELIAALPSVAARVPDAQLVFVGGGGDLPALQDLGAASPAAARLFLPGRVDDALLARLYAGAYAYVMPSRQEGFGLVYLEAMNYALPCVACREDGAADVVADGETGYLVDQPIDQDQLADTLVRLLSDPDRARALGEAGWRRLHAEFTAEAHRARVAALAAPLLAAGRRARAAVAAERT